MSIIEGPDRGQRLHVSISTHRQRRQGGARHALPTRRICRNRRGRIKRAAKFGRRRARVNQFEYFFGADMGMATSRHGHHTQCLQHSSALDLTNVLTENKEFL